MAKFVRNFRQYQSTLRANEAVAIRDDEYIVGGISISQSMINSYIKKVKDQTDKNIRQSYSDTEIAELLVKYLIDKHGDVENIPVSAILGGEEGMVDDIDELDNTTDETTVDDETMSSDETEEGSESMSMEVSGSDYETDDDELDGDLFTDDEDGIEFEEAGDDEDNTEDNTEDTEDTEDDTEDDTDSDSTMDEDELPI